MSTTTLTDCRKPFAETLIDLARLDDRIVTVCNDSVGSSNLGAFQAEFPDRMVNVGIAEQNMVGVAAGLSNAGLVPFVCAASPFLTGRALEQIKVDVAYNRSHVVLCGMSPGFAYGELGATHHSIEDLAWLRAIDGLDVVVPADARQTQSAVRWAVQHNGPAFLRISRTPVPELPVDHEPVFRPGTSQVLRTGLDATILATGTMVWRAMDAADMLADQGINVGVINVASIVPLDEATVVRVARTTPLIVTVEESVPRGGLGGAVAEVVAHYAPVEMRMLGTDTFAPTGSVSELVQHFGLDAESIAATVRAARG